MGKGVSLESAVESEVLEIISTRMTLRESTPTITEEEIGVEIEGLKERLRDLRIYRKPGQDRKLIESLREKYKKLRRLGDAICREEYRCQARIDDLEVLFIPHTLTYKDREELRSYEASLWDMEMAITRRIKPITWGEITDKVYQKVWERRQKIIEVHRKRIEGKTLIELTEEYERKKGEIQRETKTIIEPLQIAQREEEKRLIGERGVYLEGYFALEERIEEFLPKIEAITTRTSSLSEEQKDSIFGEMLVSAGMYYLEERRSYMMCYSFDGVTTSIIGKRLKKVITEIIEAHYPEFAFTDEEGIRLATAEEEYMFRKCRERGLRREAFRGIPRKEIRVEYLRDLTDALSSCGLVASAREYATIRERELRACGSSKEASRIAERELAKKGFDIGEYRRRIDEIIEARDRFIQGESSTKVASELREACSLVRFYPQI
jgi:hypothetical protein